MLFVLFVYSFLAEEVCFAVFEQKNQPSFAAIMV